MQERLGSKETLVLEDAHAEGNFVDTVSLLGSLALNQALGLEGAEFVLDSGVLRGETTDLGESEERLFFAAYPVSLPTPDS